jgi:uncharacterized protein YukE
MAINIPIITSFVNTGIQAADKQLKTFGTSAKTVAGAVGGFSLAVGTIKSVIGPAITAASDMQESLSKVNVIFGRGAKDVEKFARTAAKELGQSEQAVLNAAGTFGTFGKAAGLSGIDLATFSNDFTTLATDLASFNNTSPEEAVNAIGAALRGESEPLRRFGVLLNDATLKQEAMNIGIYDGKGALTAQQKVLAAQEAIYKQTGDAQGDFMRTSDGLANSTKTLTATFQNLQAKFGAAFLEQATTATKNINFLAAAFDNLPTPVKNSGNEINTFTSFLRNMQNPLSQIWFGLGKLREAFENTKETGAYNENLKNSAQQTMRLADASGLAKKEAAGLDDKVGGASKKLNELYDVIKDKLADALDDAKDQLEDAQDAFKDFGQSVADGIKAGFSFSDAKDAGVETGGGFLSGLRDQVAGVKQYASNVELLLQRGLSENALTAVLDAGSEAGAAIAAELVAGGQEAITGPNGVNALVATVQGVADKLGLDSAGRFYQAGVDQGKALVSGLESVLAKYEKILKNPNLSTKRLQGLLEQAQTDIAFTGITAGQTIATPAPTAAQINSMQEHQAMRGVTQNYTVNVNGGMATSAEIGRVTQDGLRALARQNGPLDIPIAGFR